jgi:hypothetical protein
VALALKAGILRIRNIVKLWEGSGGLTLSINLKFDSTHADQVLSLRIGEKIKKARTRVLMVFKKSKGYRGRSLFAVPACKFSHSITFGRW